MEDEIQKKMIIDITELVNIASLNVRSTDDIIDSILECIKKRDKELNFNIKK